MFTRTAVLSLSALLVCAGGMEVARAQELVTNGGFESGNFSGWTQFGETGYIGVNTHFPRTGQYYGFFGPFQTAGIRQSLSVQAGSQVRVSFWYKSEFGDTPNSIVATLGSVTLLNAANVTNLTYAPFTSTVTVLESNPVLSFTFHDPPDYLDMDDVSVMLLSVGGGCGSVDFNCDGDSGTDADIEAFFACLAGSCPASPCANTSDFNGDGDSGTDADIESFFRVLAGGPC
jgi:hypothetical protein